LNPREAQSLVASDNPTLKNTTSDLPQSCFQRIICRGLKAKEPLVPTAQVAFCIAKGIGHLTKKKIGHLSNAKIPQQADVQISHLWYNVEEISRKEKTA
jgi:hypothetical protein